MAVRASHWPRCLWRLVLGSLGWTVPLGTQRQDPFRAPLGAGHAVAVFSLEVLRMTEHTFPPAFILSSHFRSFLAVTLAEKDPTSVDPRWGHPGTRGCHRPRV